MTKTKTKNRKTKETDQRAVSSSPAKTEQTSGRDSTRIERRDYGTVLVKTLRSGVSIEQLMPEKPGKGREG